MSAPPYASPVALRSTLRDFARACVLCVMMALGLAGVQAPRPALAAQTVAASASAGSHTASHTGSQTGAHSLPATLRVGIVAGGWPPLEFLDGDTVNGFSADYLRLLAGPGVRLVPQVYPDMSALLAGACAAEIDIVMSIARLPQRERCLAFTVPYLSGNSAFVTRIGSEAYANPAQRLAHARIAVERGYALETILRERFAQADIVVFPDTRAALLALAQGRADVYAGFAPVVHYLLSLAAWRGLRVAYEEGYTVRELRFGVPLARQALRDQLNVAAGGVRPAAAAALRMRWLGSGADPGREAHSDGPRASPLVLDPAERAWLQSLPPLKVGFDPAWQPFIFTSGQHRTTGMSNDYLDYLARTLGVAFERVPVAKWGDADAALRRGDLAMLASAGADGGLSPDTLYTRAIEHYPLVIVGRRDEPMARDTRELANRRSSCSATRFRCASNAP